MPNKPPRGKTNKPTVPQQSGSKRKASKNTSSSAQDESLVDANPMLSKHLAKKNKKDISATSTPITSHFATIGLQSTMIADSMRADDTPEGKQTSLADDIGERQSSEATPQSKDEATTQTERVILAKLTQNGEKMDTILRNVERMEMTLFNLQVENDRLKKSVFRYESETRRVTVDRGSVET